eukprot:GCRY01002377.1.p1 GENE.GCRY01002377.1~~GCRY01002377.1.p1  ORF type:complete len:304 (+),score=70.95 GCRY01002377.1:749-1660(+)
MGQVLARSNFELSTDHEGYYATTSGDAFTAHQGTAPTASATANSQLYSHNTLFDKGVKSQWSTESDDAFVEHQMKPSYEWDERKAFLRGTHFTIGRPAKMRDEASLQRMYETSTQAHFQQPLSARGGSTPAGRPGEAGGLSAKPQSDHLGFLTGSGTDRGHDFSTTAQRDFQQFRDGKEAIQQPVDSRKYLDSHITFSGGNEPSDQYTSTTAQSYKNKQCSLKDRVARTEMNSASGLQRTHLVLGQGPVEPSVSSSHEHFNGKRFPVVGPKEREEKMDRKMRLYKSHFNLGDNKAYYQRSSDL